MIQNKRVLKIGNRVISQFNKPLIIPELGINHNGSIETAFKIVDAAKRSGAEIIKHQNEASRLNEYIDKAIDEVIEQSEGKI